MLLTSDEKEFDGAKNGLRWKRIAGSLRDDIRGRRLQPGAQLMTEVDLAVRFGVSRSTIRRALAELEKEGLVRIEHGRGIFIAEDVVAYALGERTRWTENMERSHLSWRRTVLGSAIEEADSTVRRHLDLAHGADVICVDFASEIDGRPLSVGRNYYPAERFPGFDEMLSRDPSPTKAFRAFGIADYTRKTTWIVSRLPTTREAHLLRIAKTRPVLQTEKIDIDPEGRPVAYGIICYCGDRIQLVVA
jgi:GntR family phosphonate transport system transcriptional regulator